MGWIVLFLMILSEAYQEEDLSTTEKKDSRVVLKFPPKLAPVKLAILPLVKKDGLPEIAKEILAECRGEFRCFYEEKDTIGKRYRRMDAIGTPFSVTVDYQIKGRPYGYYPVPGQHAAGKNTHKYHTGNCGKTNFIKLN